MVIPTGIELVTYRLGICQTAFLLFPNARRLVPFGRIGKPEEVAALVAFLASDEAALMCGSLVEITGAQAVAWADRGVANRSNWVVCVKHTT